MQDFNASPTPVVKFRASPLLSEVFLATYYCFFPDNYTLATLHLGWLEDLAYRRLLDLYYHRGQPLPNDRAFLLRAVRANEPEQQAAVDTVLAEFFQLKGDGWHNIRADEELVYITKKSEAGIKANTVRWERARNKNNDLTHPTGIRPESGGNPPTPTPTPTPTTEKKPRELRSRASPDVAIEILNFLNSKTGRNYKPVAANLEIISARLKEGFSVDDIRSVVAMKCQQWGRDDKMVQFLRPATLFNRTNFAQYEGQLHAEE